jgi:hypothetical protein
MHSPNIFFLLFPFNDATIRCLALSIVSFVAVEAVKIHTRSCGGRGDDSRELYLLHALMVAGLTIKSAI